MKPNRCIIIGSARPGDGARTTADPPATDQATIVRDRQRCAAERSRLRRVRPVPGAGVCGSRGTARARRGRRAPCTAGAFQAHQHRPTRSASARARPVRDARRVVPSSRAGAQLRLVSRPDAIPLRERSRDGIDRLIVPDGTWPKPAPRARDSARGECLAQATLVRRAQRVATEERADALCTSKRRRALRILEATSSPT